MSLRVMAKPGRGSVDSVAIGELLGCPTDSKDARAWRLHAPPSEGADLDAQVAWLLSRVTADVEIWKNVTQEYRVDLFCGLFLERQNRGVTLSPQTLLNLGNRGIAFGFDIYGPNKDQADASAWLSSQ
jgi:hypothetical protein